MMARLRHPPWKAEMAEIQHAAPQNIQSVTPATRLGYAPCMDDTDDAVERRLLAEAVAVAETAPASADTPHATVRTQLLATRNRLQARLGRAGAP